MTKVQHVFELAAPLDQQTMSRLARVYSTYGILRIQAEPGSEKLIVEYDATRFSPRDVEAVLARAGLPLSARSV
jgi:hypothetical protein